MGNTWQLLNVVITFNSLMCRPWASWKMTINIIICINIKQSKTEHLKFKMSVKTFPVFSFLKFLWALIASGLFMSAFSMINPPLSVSVRRCRRCFNHVTDWLASLLGEIPLGFSRWKLAQRSPGAAWGMEQQRVRAGWGASAACMSQQWAQAANWFGEIPWP